jgi:hypothetical protein
MKFRIVTVTLTVALGVWSVAWAQTQEKLLDFAVPAQEFDRSLESELPLQGVLGDSAIHGSIAEAIPPQSPAARTGGDWMDPLRRRISRTPRRSIALGSAAVCALFFAGWVAGSVSSRRVRRAYRRLPRSSGGSSLQGLEAVVASVQRRRKTRVGRPTTQDPITGREWPR